MTGRHKHQAPGLDVLGVKQRHSIVEASANAILAALLTPNTGLEIVISELHQFGGYTFFVGTFENVFQQDIRIAASARTAADAKNFVFPQFKLKKISVTFILINDAPI